MKKKLKKLTAFMVSATMVFPIFGEYPSGTFKLGWDSSFSASAVEDLSPAEEITVNIDTGESVTLSDNDNNGYYDIGTADELYAFASIVNNSNTAINVELTTDITVNDNVLDKYGELNSYNSDNFRVWTPIGNYSNKYKGTFNGQNHTISGLYFDNENQDYVGLFGYIETSALIKNVGVINSFFNGDEYIGGVCGFNEKCIITNSYSTSDVIGNNGVGGVCGENYYGTITNCYNTGSVNGDSDVGGVCGGNLGESTNCYNTGSVSGTDYIGGMCGFSIDTMRSCYNTGSVSGINYVGGVCGINANIITNCYYDNTVYTGVEIGDDYGISENVLGKSTAAFASGEVAFLLQKEQPEYIWGQKIGADDSPVLNINDKVYQHTYNDKIVYTNSETAPTKCPHFYDENGFCALCDINYEKPETDKNNIYQISNAGELYWFMENVNAGNTSANAVLTADIVVNESLEGNPRKWFPIGYWYDRNGDGYKEDVYYTGIFDGQNHTISGLYFNNFNQVCIGLFGQISKSAEIKNVGVINSFFSGNNNIGGICGYNYGTITNCYNTDDVTGLSDNVGGVCGYNYNTITNCNNAGDVNGNNKVGGVCGYSLKSIITNCYNTGDIYGNNKVGGVCGDGTGTITNCYNQGLVSGYDYVAGVCGISSAAITYCYNTGAISGNSCVGGIYGLNNSSNENTNCYNIGIVSGDKQIGGLCGYNYGDFTNCYNAGAISGNTSVGGMCGFNNSDAIIKNCYNTSDVSGNRFVGDMCGLNYGRIINCYYLAESETDNDYGTAFKTEIQFAIGEVAYLLNGDQTTIAWYQTIGEDAHPVLDNTHETVYYGYLHCYDTDMQYTNDSNISDTISNHTYGYTATDNIITVSCVNNGCNEKGTIEIFANDRSCDGEAVTATVINTFDETDYNNQIVYKDSEGNIVDKAVIGGTYTANLTIEGVTASVEFVITHVGGNATCTEKATCDVCGEQYGEVDAENHSGETEIKNAADATCTVEGYTGDTCCKDCGAVLESGKTIESNGHVGGNATCTEKATCEVCGERYGEVDAENHSGETEIKNAADSTCTAEGYTGDTCCKDCGAVLAEGEIIKAEGHEYICVVKDIPDANENIILTYICKKCDDTYTEEIVNIPDPAKGVTAEVTYATYSGNGGQIEITFTNGGEDIIGGWNIELDLNIDGKLTNT
ncbi:MAG: hypothetical protein IKI94_08360 [Ruminococcus sp.]|nr:hypothetical protein [Ruminococcus sp.]